MNFLKTCSILFILIYIFLNNCSSNKETIINESDFVTIYARLTIINELNVNRDYHDKLVEELLTEFNIQVNDIQKTVDFYQQNPQDWLEILEKVKDKINDLRKRDTDKQKLNNNLKFRDKK